MKIEIIGEIKKAGLKRPALRVLPYWEIKKHVRHQ